ncbi:MAG TPA: GNAT family N-acetyltransferase [Gemmatimonadales bacterium]|nr:GNAT family N-acetyltransferase [Gemmatimonadales bacterium]
MRLSVRPLEPRDHDEWLRMREALWPELDRAGHDIDAREWLAQPDVVVLVAERPAGGLAGFAEVGTRAYVDGCATSPVADLEGWFVDADVRRAGVGAALVRAAERWARERGLSEFASDALLDNVDSQRAHEALGFTEVERAVRYAKRL